MYVKKGITVGPTERRAFIKKFQLFSTECVFTLKTVQLKSTRNAEVVLQKTFWLAYSVYICNTVDSYSQPQIFTLHERSIATAIGKRA